MKQMTAWGIAIALLPGCLPGTLISGQTTMGSGGGQGSGSNGMITVPDVFGMPKERAVAELRRAGFQGSIVDDSSSCGSIVEGRVIEVGRVCDQHPVPGRKEHGFPSRYACRPKTRGTATSASLPSGA